MNVADQINNSSSSEGAILARMAERHLFGGAIVAQFPSNLIDVSDLRQVPDNQEVFLYPDSNDSIIVEVLERVSGPNDEEAVKFHFEALAHDNAATSSTVQAVSVVPNDRGDWTPSPIVLRGSQSVLKFNATVPDYVDILMAVFRVHFQRKSADLVITTNIPRASERNAGEEHANAIASQFSADSSPVRLSARGTFPHSDGSSHNPHGVVTSRSRGASVECNPMSNPLDKQKFHVDATPSHGYRPTGC